MRKVYQICLFAIGLLGTTSIIAYIPVWTNDARTRRNKDSVRELIEIGQNLDSAGESLRKAGFKLRYGRPIAPTNRDDVLEQLVIVGETRPNAFETIAYAANLRWMPFIPGESPYVIINADLDGTISEIR